jgi:hypothetical protein
MYFILKVSQTNTLHITVENMEIMIIIAIVIKHLNEKITTFILKTNKTVRFNVSIKTFYTVMT